MTRDEFVKEAGEIALELDRYLKDRRAGKPGPGSATQLESLARYIRAIAEHVRAGALPPRPERQSKSLGWILVDGWDPDDPLGARILPLDSWYLKL